MITNIENNIEQLKMEIIESTHELIDCLRNAKTKDDVLSEISSTELRAFNIPHKMNTPEEISTESPLEINLADPKTAYAVFYTSIIEFPKHDIVVIKDAERKILSHYYLPKTILIHLDKVRSPSSEWPASIKVREFSKAGADPERGRPGYLITLIYENERKEERLSYIISYGMCHNVATLTSSADELALAEYYIDKPTHALFANDRSQAEAWGQWEDLDAHMYYDLINDPIVLNACEKFVKPLAHKVDQTAPFTILDIGAGKGRLAKKLIEMAQKFGRNLNYIFVEPNESQIETAKKELSSLINENCNITFIQANLQELKLDQSVNCIISSGGPLNMRVVYHDEAIININTLSQLLQQQGIIIATGYTPLHVKSKHFENTGLKPLAYVSDCPRYSQILPPQVYQEYMNNLKKGKEGAVYLLPDGYPYLINSADRYTFFGKIQSYVFEKSSSFTEQEKPLPSNRI